MSLTGNEAWIVAGKEGHEIYAKSAGLWWPIVHVELDFELIKIDVCGHIDILNLFECDIKIGDEGEQVKDVYRKAIKEQQRRGKDHE